jgi:hypothetical protein
MMHTLSFSYVLTDLHDSAHRPGQDATGADSAALGADGRARADRRERDRFGDEMLRQEQSGRDPFKVPARRAVPSGEVRIAKAIRPQSGPGFAEVRRDVALGPAMRTSTIATTNTPCAIAMLAANKRRAPSGWASCSKPRWT